MRRLFLLPLLLVVALSATGQVLMPAHWSYSVSNPNPKVGEEIDLIFSAEIDKDWYLYANEFVCEDGPNHTTMTFKAHPSFELVGKIRDIKPQKKHDKIFDCDVMIYRGVAEFRQTIKVLQNKPVIQGNTDYQVCTDVDGRCIPFDEDFSFDSITASGSATQGNGFQSSGQNPIPLTTTTPTDTEVHGPTLDKSILEGTPALEQESFLGYLLFAFVLGLARGVRVVDRDLGGRGRRGGLVGGDDGRGNQAKARERDGSERHEGTLLHAVLLLVFKVTPN
jgi:thiol:disulfide interchange protein DsbD